MKRSEGTQRRGARAYAAALTLSFALLACPGPAEEVEKSEAALQPTSFSLVVLPDTQCYVFRAPEILDAQIDWILAEREAREIRFVAHLGDVVQHNTPEEWKRAKQSIGRLAGVVPFSLLPGNHDMGAAGSADRRSSLMDRYFDRGELDTGGSFAGGFEADSIWNTQHAIPGTDWMLLSLEFGPRASVLEWADRRVAEHPDRRFIVVTHAFLYHDGRRFDRSAEPPQRWNVDQYGLGSDASDGQQIWDGLVSRHANIRLVLSGHVLGDGVARLTSKGRDGQIVHQLLSNYQVTGRECPEREDGGGYLRIMRFDERPGGPTGLEVSTYSPWRDAWDRDSEQSFSLELAPLRRAPPTGLPQ